MAQTESNSILKNKADILGKKDCLLGKDFWNQVVENTGFLTQKLQGQSQGSSTNSSVYVLA